MRSVVGLKLTNISLIFCMIDPEAAVGGGGN